MLDEAGYVHERVYAVDADAILYVNKMGAARTCWIHRQQGSGRLKVRMEEGFPAEAPAGWHE